MNLQLQGVMVNAEHEYDDLLHIVLRSWHGFEISDTPRSVQVWPNKSTRKEEHLWIQNAIQKDIKKCSQQRSLCFLHCESLIKIHKCSGNWDAVPRLHSHWSDYCPHFIIFCLERWKLLESSWVERWRQWCWCEQGGMVPTRNAAGGNGDWDGSGSCFMYTVSL